MYSWSRRLQYQFVVLPLMFNEIWVTIILYQNSACLGWIWSLVFGIYLKRLNLHSNNQKVNSTLPSINQSK